MRIIGGSDYYDSAMAFGRDETILFKRNSGRTLTLDDVHGELNIPRRQPAFTMVVPGAKQRRLPDYFSPVRRRTTQEVRLRGCNIAFQPLHVVFCGKSYCGITAVETTSTPVRQTITRIWHANALSEFCAARGIEIEDSPTRTMRDNRLDGRGIWQDVDVNLDSLKDYFTPLPIEPGKLGPLISQRVTIMVRIIGSWSRDPVWNVDGCDLSEIGFAKAVDPHTAFQEISMWLGGVLGAEKPNLVEITDDRIKVEKHGFHHPTSFRRSKGSK